MIRGALGFSSPTCTITIETAEGTVDTAVSLGVASFAGFIPSLIVATKILAASTIIEATFATASIALSEEQINTPNIDWLVSAAQRTYAFLTSLKDFHEFEDGSETNLGWSDLAKNTVHVAAYAGAYTAKFLGGVASSIEWLSGN